MVSAAPRLQDVVLLDYQGDRTVRPVCPLMGTEIGPSDLIDWPNIDGGRLDDEVYAIYDRTLISFWDGVEEGRSPRFLDPEPVIDDVVDPVHLWREGQDVKCVCPLMGTEIEWLAPASSNTPPTSTTSTRGVWPLTGLGFAGWHRERSNADTVR